jgi:hypothetical protein
MSIMNAVFGTATQVSPQDLAAEFHPILIDGEEIVAAFKIVRDLVVFTQVRMILTDKQGITGKKVDYHSIPYKSITMFAVETAGTFDMDAELKIWVSGYGGPIKKEFKKGTDVRQIQKILAHYALR